MTTIGTIFEVANVIYKQVATAASNKKQCIRLAARVKRIEQALRQLDDIASSPAFAKSLDELKACLDDCLRLIKKMGGIGWVKGVLRSGKYSNRFDKLNDRLRNIVQEMNLGMNIERLFDKLQSNRDLEDDLQFIQANQEKILHEHLKVSSDIGAMHSYQKNEFELMRQNTESMQLQLQRIFVTQQVPKKSLVPEHFKANFFDITFEELIMKGSFASIHIGRYQTQQVAIKWLQGDITDTDKERLLRDINIMSKLRSPFIVPFHAACLEPERCCLLMEYVPKNLHRTLQDQLSDASKHRLAISIAKGLRYLHSRGILHRNLSDTNVLVSNNNVAKLTDFGMAKISSNNTINTFAEVAYDPRWTAPEVLQPHDEYPVYADVYSYGMLLWSIFTQKRPFANYNSDSPELLNNIIQGHHELISENIPDIYSKIIRSCWDTPERRPSMESIVKQLEEYRLPRDIYRDALAQESKDNHEQAYSLYLQAASAGYYKAQMKVASFYLSGKVSSIAKDTLQAINWLKKAGAQGYAKAWYNLGMIYAHGDGIDRNITLAANYFRKAAECGHTVALAEHERFRNFLKTLDEGNNLESLSAYKAFTSLLDKSPDYDVASSMVTLTDISSGVALN